MAYPYLEDLIRRALREELARVEWYDRNPIQTSVSYLASNVPPHEWTLRSSYTVPSGRKALLCGCHMIIRRRTAPTTAGDFYAESYCFGTGVACIHSSSGVVGGGESISMGCWAVAEEGEDVTIETWDDSTGGAVDYSLLVSITEFDA